MQLDKITNVIEPIILDVALVLTVHSLWGPSVTASGDVTIALNC
jgi:hypothetical protein